MLVKVMIAVLFFNGLCDSLEFFPEQSNKQRDKSGNDLFNG